MSARLIRWRRHLGVISLLPCALGASRGHAQPAPGEDAERASDPRVMMGASRAQAEPSPEREGIPADPILGAAVSTPAVTHGGFETREDCIAAFGTALPFGLGGVVGGSFLMREAKHAYTDDGEIILTGLGLTSYVIGAGLAAFGAIALVEFIREEPAEGATTAAVVPVGGGAALLMLGSF